MRTVQVLVKIKDETVVEPLINRLKDKDLFVVQKSNEALIELGEITVQPLIKALDDDDKDFKKRVVSILGKISDERAVYPLIENLKDENDTVRQEIVLALIKFRKRAIKPLINSLNDDTCIVR